MGIDARDRRNPHGGFSGGSMERPALVRLLADVQAGKIDIVIVYKVDRLTRSLNDFARIVDVFDAAGVSFVSVTQQFNTTTSMGRLTLNVLLSFAQFEREVIAERVRDKIAQSKAKGMWMGGPVPLGYDVIDRKLVPNAAEGATVVHIFQSYLALPSVMALMEQLKADGVVTKKQVMRDGSIRGGLPFVRGPLYHLLSNPIYIGQIRHRDRIHEGQHTAIIDRDLWEAVQAKRRSAIGSRRDRGNGGHASLLTGMIRDHADRPMSPSHAVKSGRRYRYYVSSTTGPAIEQSPCLRLPAPQLEESVINAIAGHLANAHTIAGLAQVDARMIQQRIHAADALRSILSAGRKKDVREALQAMNLLLEVRIDGIAASISRRRLVAMLDGVAPDNMDDGVRISIDIPTVPDQRGHNLKLVLASEGAGQRKVDRDLVALLRKAEAARQQLFTQAHAAHDRSTERIARLAFLAPDIVTAILDGRQPSELTCRKLMKMAAIPMDWKAQREALGFD
ncbi:recombinase family protein [Sphingobium olei]|uniref:Recombinase family protein n=1 Tax=Sphingobium olei TaxID=420955 RepID=A0ABW3NYY4_9SPHN